MQDNLTDGMELCFLKDGLTLLTFNVQMDKVGLIRVNDVAKQNHRRIEMYLFASSIEDTRNTTFLTDIFSIRLAEICSSIPYNLNTFCESNTQNS